MQLDYGRAVELLDHLREHGSVKAYNDLREQIAQRWPDSSAGRDAAAWLERARTTIEERALEVALAREAAYRSRLASERDDAAKASIDELEAARTNASQVADAVDARSAGKTARRDQQHAVALIYAERAFQLEADVFSGLFLASSQRHAGLLDAALDCYRSLWDERSERHMVITGAAAVLADLGRIAEAWDLLEPQLGERADAYALALAARLRRLLGDLSSAERYLRRAWARPVDRAELRRELRELERQASDAGDTSIAAAARELRAH